jgi:peptidoglycan/xylan/chitin deacetylase (PgdA/CDA1 family)
MQSAARRGRGVIFTGLTGVRDGGCREVGFGLVASLLRSARADTVESSLERYITIPAGSPLAVDIPPGARIEVKPAPHVVVRHPGRDAYYSDRDLNPVTVGERAFLDGAVAHDLSAGRVVYFGFDASTLAERHWERSIMSLLVRNAVALAAGISLASPDAWPAGHAAAAVIAQDVEDEFENARHALDTLRAAQVPGTFFVVSDLARRHQELTRAMGSDGEVGTHTENHARLGGGLELQRRRLAATQEQLTALLGHPVRGMRPPEEQFDGETLLAWKEAGGTYVFGANDGRSPSPELVQVGGAPFVLIGRTADDDFLTVRRAQMTDPARLAADQLEAFAKVRALGGLYIMSYHSNMLARASTVAAVGIVARALRADTTTWLTTAARVSEWWLVRHEMVSTVTRDARGDVLLTVRNGAARATPAASVTVTLPGGGHAVAAADSELMDALPGTVRVRIPPLAPGGSHSTRIAVRKGGRRAS